MNISQILILFLLIFMNIFLIFLLIKDDDLYNMKFCIILVQARLKRVYHLIEAI